AAAAYCAADQDRFWDYHSELFLTQARAGQLTTERTNVGRFAEDELRSIAETVGLDMAAYDACMASPEPLEVVAQHEQEATSLGIRGTPGFVINGQPQAGGPASVEGWRDFLDQAYEAATGG